MLGALHKYLLGTLDGSDAEALGDATVGTAIAFLEIQ